MIEKKVFKSISLVSAGTVVNSAFGAAFALAVARALGETNFGTYFLLTSAVVLISKIMDMGTDSIFVTYSITKAKNLIDNFFSLKYILFAITLPLSYFFLLIFNLNTFANIMIFLVGLIGYGINRLLYTIFQKEEKFFLVVLINFLPAIIKGTAAVLIFLDLYLVTTTNSFAIFCYSILSSVIFTFFVPKTYINFNFDLNGTLQLIKDSYKPGISQLIMTGWSSITSSVAAVLTTQADVGIYGLAQKIANIFSLVAFSIFTVLLPKNAKRKKQKLKYDFKEAAFISFGIIVAAVAAIFFAQLFIELFFEGRFKGSIALLPIVVTAGALTAILTFMDNYFFVEDKTDVILYTGLIRLIGFVAFSIALAANLGITGIAIANLVGAILALFVAGYYVLSNLKN